MGADTAGRGNLPAAAQAVDGSDSGRHAVGLDMLPIAHTTDPLSLVELSGQAS